MKFLSDGPSIPDVLLERCDAGRVVFLCGAGVSFNSGMPTFLGLTEHVIEFFDPPEDSQIMTAFAPWLEKNSAANVPLDQIFNLLHQEYGRDEVNALVTERLLVPPTAKTVGHEHNLIKRISSNQNGIPQIVTTNFDHLFEHGGGADGIPIHVPPAFPDLVFGSPVDGITYLHGRLVPPDAPDHPYVLSSADFGRAYLSEAWATKFISGLLERYTVVLVGYQAEDPPVKYLLQGLNHDGQFDGTRLYAFDKGLSEEIEAKWRDRGVSAIAYQDHEHLWKTMEAWADRADEPRAWRAKIVASTISDPKAMSAHERGQVAHVLRSIQGTRLFADADPLPHPEWVCVLDPFSRNAKRSADFGDDVEIFEPSLVYGLDDDVGPISDEDFRRGIRNDNLIEWRHGDENPPDFHRLGGRPAAGQEPVPARLWNLIRWIGNSFRSPTIAWWAVRQFGLHPRLLDHIERQLRQSKELDAKCRHIWSLILEFHRDPRNHQWDGNWYELKERLAAEGWTPSVLRDFRRMTQPRLAIERPSGLHQNKPPVSDWPELNYEEIGRFSIKFLDRHDEQLDVPDDHLPAVFDILEDQLISAAGVLSDIRASFFETPTCYPERETDGGEQLLNSTDKAFIQFVQMFDRLSDLRPSLAKAHAEKWDEKDVYFFHKLKLYALAKKSLFDANEVASIISSLEQKVFWDIGVVRELLFAIIDRWSEFSEDSKEAVAKRILAGPDQLDHWSDEEFPGHRDRIVSRYGRYLQLRGCALPNDVAAELETLMARVPDWTDQRAISAVTDHGMHGGMVQVDETPDEIADAPVGEVLERARATSKREFASLIERRPFKGLVKSNPRKALAAVSVASKKGEFPEFAWEALIEDFPDEVSSRLHRLFLNRLLRLPSNVVCKLNHSLSRWLKRKLEAVLEFDDTLGWQIYDHIVGGILSGGPEAVESGMGQVFVAGEAVHQSRRTVDHAINGPIGKCAEALIKAVPGEKQAAGSLLPDHIKARFEQLFSAGGEAADHAISVLLLQLNWAMYVDPIWTKEHLIPKLAFDHPAAEPAWNGFLHSPNNPSGEVVISIKPLLLELYPWIEQFEWGRTNAERAASWLAWMHIFRAGEPDGLDRREMRGVLRAMSDSARNQLIFWLGKVGAKNEDGWKQLVIPFINEVWPRERVYRTSASVTRWIGLLDDTMDDFPSVLAAVKKFLVPIESDGIPLYRFTRDVRGEDPITVKYPEETLDLLDCITPAKLSRPPYELPKILTLIEESAPELTNRSKYLRLIDLVERT